MTFRRGFTLVELLIVIIIIAVLTAIAAPKFANKKVSAQESAARSDLKNIRNAIARFYNDTGLYPNSENDLTAKTRPTDGVYWNGSSWVTAPVPNTWSGPYIYKYPSCPIADYSYEAVRVGTARDVRIKPDNEGGSNPYRFW
ncbi:MAG: type II secretion system protein GspG [Fimbriimonadaceae bacterium]